MVLNKINNPSDLKKLEFDELKLLSNEIRELLINKTSVTGGHLGGNLGIVECTIALHYLFDLPTDKIIFDVSHQSYTHKILSGRKEFYSNPQRYREISGYTNPQESEYDLFTVGHTSTSVSLACGVALSRDLKNEKFKVIALIGDGSLSGGEGLEGLDFAGEYKGNLIIVVNDNGMSIAENHGGLYKNLELLRNTRGQAELNLFKALGLDYIFVENGNDIEELITAFSTVKDIDHPVVVHICTTKGKGFEPAENNKEVWHWHPPFDKEKADGAPFKLNDFVEFTRDILLEKIEQDDRVAVICAGTPSAIGFSKAYREKAGDRFIDVGIAEEHAVAMTSAMAKTGTKPIFCVQSSFLQRCYDQLSHDLALNNSPAVILVYSSGLYLLNDATHLGIFDMSYTSNIPNLTCLAPTSTVELKNALDSALNNSSGAVIIRVPSINFNDNLNGSIDLKNKGYSIVQQGQEVAVIALGNQFSIGRDLCQLLKANDINPTLINPLYYDFVDEKLLSSLTEKHSLFVVLEDGILEGGFSHKIAGYLSKFGVKVLCYGYKKEFIDRFNANEILIKNGMTSELIAKEVLKNLK